MKLGKKPVRYDGRTLKLSNYLKSLPPIPPRIEWSATETDWSMMLNDTLGDCTCACAGHMIRSWYNAASSKQVVVPDAEILTAYEAVSGYTPSDPNSDNGADILT